MNFVAKRLVIAIQDCKFLFQVFFYGLFEGFNRSSCHHHLLNEQEKFELAAKRVR